MRSLGAFAALLLIGAGLALPVVSEGRPRDRDGDGLTNKRERLRLNTNPRRADTDGDRLRDKFELRRSHTDPRRADTDGDGDADGVELLLGTDPLEKPRTRRLIDPAPETSIVSGPSGTVASSAASFGFSSSEPGSSFRCRLDRTSWISCASPRGYVGLANGSHTFEVQAVDAAGNVDPSPASRKWTVDVPPPDTTAPETSISAGPSGTVASASASLSFSSSETGSSFECRLDGGAWGSCSSPKAYSGLANGSHTFDVRAIDSAGNTDASPGSRTWTVNVPPPPSGSANVYLSASGSDSAACTQASPCQSMARGYALATAGQVVQLATGTYPRQEVPSGTKAVIFRGGPGVKIRQLISDASNVTYDGIEVDAGGVKTTWAALEIHGSGATFKNASVGNVVDEKALLVVGANHTIDNVLFHDAVYKTDGVHMECVYAIGVPGFTIRNSTFRDCAIMDLLFTYGSWWSPLPPSYGNVTIENNVFVHAEMENNAGWHYYSLYVGAIGPEGTATPMNGWVVRNNTFEQTARVAPESAAGSRWVGNLGAWDCVPGMQYGYNVGKKCGASDKPVSPASSSGTVAAALGWVNPGAYDFHLTPGSPAINAADPNDHPPLDREGLVRDGTPDAGAYEFR